LLATMAPKPMKVMKAKNRAKKAPAMVWRKKWNTVWAGGTYLHWILYSATVNKKTKFLTEVWHGFPKDPKEWALWKEMQVQATKAKTLEAKKAKTLEAKKLEAQKLKAKKLEANKLKAKK
jgi:hypothetical protein